MMTSARRGRNGALAQLRVETVTRDDGRYLLYYSWPTQPAPEGDVAPSPGGATQPARGQRAWTPEAGPAADGDNGRDV